MVKRSRAEIFLSAHLLSAFGALSEEAVIDSMNEGNKRGNKNSSVDLAYVGIPGVPEMLVGFDPFNPKNDMHGVSMMKKLGVLKDKLLTLDKAQVVAFTQSCRGGLNTKRDVVANAL